MLPGTSLTGVSSCLVAGGCFKRGAEVLDSDRTVTGRLGVAPDIGGVAEAARRGVCGVRAVLLEARVGLRVLP